MKVIAAVLMMCLSVLCMADNMLVNGDMKNDKGWMIWGSAPTDPALRSKILTDNIYFFLLVNTLFKVFFNFFRLFFIFIKITNYRRKIYDFYIHKNHNNIYNSEPDNENNGKKANRRA